MFDYKVIPAQEQKELILQYRIEGCIDSRNKLILHSSKLIHHVINSFLSNRVSLRRTIYEDLFQEGTIGLIRAIDLFDLDRGTNFSTYATYWVRLRVRSFIQDNSLDALTGTPTCKRQALAKFNVAREAAHLRGDNFDEVKLAKSFGLTSSDISQNKLFFAVELKPEDSVMDPIQEKTLYYKEVIDILNTMGEGLSPIQISIIRDRIMGEATLEEIGNKFKLTKERVRQIESVLTKKMKTRFSRDGVLL